MLMLGKHLFAIPYRPLSVNWQAVQLQRVCMSKQISTRSGVRALVCFNVSFINIQPKLSSSSQH
ncbi:hypothetical protein B9Z50_03765 [Limnohabitans sp. Bal53]|nr:hypothetical protein B9Z50_03765 [Limnohabitans sp. Bal53]